MRFGLNLWALNQYFIQNPETFLKQAKERNYRYIEPCISLQTVPGFENRLWTPELLALYYPMLEKAGMHIDSCHAFTRHPLQEAEKMAAIASEYHIGKVVYACPVFDSETAGKALAADFRELCALMAAKGIAVLIHNGKEASEGRMAGVSLYEWFLTEVGTRLQAQPDAGWLAYGGVDPEAFLWKYQSQVASLHYKDMKDTGCGRTETPIGTGLVDMTACFQFARYQEIIQIADQDQYGDDCFEDLSYIAGKFRELSSCRENTRSILCVYDTETGTVSELKTFDRIIEAPNWLQTDPDTLIFNSDGRIWRYSISAGTEEVINTGKCTNCNNDHVLSPDNTRIAISHSDTGWMSQVYIANLDGTGEPRLITPNYPSFLHGWSFDGKELAYCAFRGPDAAHIAVDIYTIPSDGGNEVQLTKDTGFNDGPEYAPGDTDLWFISTRTGLMQCWKMDRNGGNQKQMTFCLRNNWFPHISPDSSKVVYLSYSKEGLDPSEHLPNMQVQLRMMQYDGSDDHEILSFFGGQGSINVNSWHPDSKKFAFVKYELEHK